MSNQATVPTLESGDQITAVPAEYVKQFHLTYTVEREVSRSKSQVVILGRRLSGGKSQKRTDQEPREIALSLATVVVSEPKES
jgi:hypothetical protein